VQVALNSDFGSNEHMLIMCCSFSSWLCVCARACL